MTQAQRTARPASAPEVPRLQAVPDRPAGRAGGSGASPLLVPNAWEVMTRMVTSSVPHLSGTYVESRKGQRPEALRFVYRSTGSWTLGDGRQEHRIVRTHRRERRGPQARGLVQVPAALRTMVEPRWLPVFTGRRAGGGNYRAVHCAPVDEAGRPSWHLRFIDQDEQMPRLDLVVDETWAVVVRLVGQDVTRRLIDLATPSS